MEKFLYSFNEDLKNMPHLLGEKGASLAEMTKIGLPVPFGFTLTTETCAKFFDDRETLDETVQGQLREKISELEEVTGRVFGDSENPLLVSVRAGAEFALPGMLDTILNLGINDDIAAGLAAQSGSERFAYDCYQRFLQMYGVTVCRVPRELFALPGTESPYEENRELTAEELKQIVERFKKVIVDYTGREVPADPAEQLTEAIKALFRSWKRGEAVLYRRVHEIPDYPGTAVTVQMMVFGNLNKHSGTGVAFTRSPINGENKAFGEFLLNAQGEDVVSGYRTPRPLKNMTSDFPELYPVIEKVAEVLERHYKSIQGMEFTIENHRLYLLQTRQAKQTVFSTIRTAVDMVEEGNIDKETAIMRIDPGEIHQILHLSFDGEEEKAAEILGTGLPASPGAASGRICFSASAAKKAAELGETAILVRKDTSPSDFSGMLAAEGILTARGGTTSYAAMVARSMGKSCISGCPELTINEKEKTLSFGSAKFREGDYLSLNGSKGTVYRGRIKTVPAKFSEEFNKIMSWADECRTMKIRANIDSAAEAEQAMLFGAEGIGLYRTEHMFFAKDHLKTLHRLLTAENRKEAEKLLQKIFSSQKAEFRKLYRIVEDKPVTIRLLDHSLYEIFIRGTENVEKLAEVLDVPYRKMKQIAGEYYRSATILGHRGCRLAVIYPEIIRVQVRAIVEAACELRREQHIDIVPEILIPFVGSREEFSFENRLVSETIAEYLKEEGEGLDYHVGALIEVPRAAFVAEQIAEEAEFFSFGTNDMTQLVYGLSRNNTGDLIKAYIDQGIFRKDPFQTIDEEGVGEVIKMTIKKGRQTRKGLRIGLCGEHGGDPESIDFCQRIGLNYISCSPYRVPVARIAAAQAAIRRREEV